MPVSFGQTTTAVTPRDKADGSKKSPSSRRSSGNSTKGTKDNVAYLRSIGAVDIIEELTAELLAERPATRDDVDVFFAERALSRLAARSTAAARSLWRAVADFVDTAPAMVASAGDGGGALVGEGFVEFEDAGGQTNCFQDGIDGGLCYLVGAYPEQTGMTVDSIEWRPLDCELLVDVTDEVWSVTLPPKCLPVVAPALADIARRSGVPFRNADAWHGTGQELWGLAAMREWSGDALRDADRAAPAAPPPDSPGGGGRSPAGDDDDDALACGRTATVAELPELDTSKACAGPATEALLGAAAGRGDGALPLLRSVAALRPPPGALTLALRPDLAVSDVYRKGRMLGEGSFGRVYRVKHRGTGTVYALKEEDAVEVEEIPDGDRVQHGSHVHGLRRAFPDVPAAAPGAGDAPLSGTVCWLGGDTAGVRFDTEVAGSPGGGERFAAPPGWGACAPVARLWTVAPAQVAIMRRLQGHQNLLGLVDWRSGSYEYGVAGNIRTSDVRAVSCDRLRGAAAAARRGVGADADAGVAALREVAQLCDTAVGELSRRTRPYARATSGKAILVMEFTPGGDLESNLEGFAEQFDGVTERLCACIFKAVVSGCCHIHEQGIVHHDLKPANMLLTTRLPDNISEAAAQDHIAKKVRICDFGTSKFEDDLRVNPMTPVIRAPEVVAAFAFQDDKEEDNEAVHELLGSVIDVGRCPLYGRESDVWALGVAIYNILTGEEPVEFSWETRQYLVSQRGGPRFEEPQWAQASAEARDLVVRLLSYDPAKRPTAHDVLNDAWFTSQLGESSPEVAAPPAPRLRTRASFMHRASIALHPEQQPAAPVQLLATPGQPPRRSLFPNAPAAHRPSQHIARISIAVPTEAAATAAAAARAARPPRPPKASPRISVQGEIGLMVPPCGGHSPVTEAPGEVAGRRSVFCGAASHRADYAPTNRASVHHRRSEWEALCGPPRPSQAHKPASAHPTARNDGGG